MAEASQLLSVLKQADHVLKIYEAQVFIEAGQLLSRMLPCQGNGIRGICLRLTNSAYKAARKKTTELRRGLKAQWAIAIAELSEALETRQQWRRLSESDAMPKAVPGTQNCDQLHQAAQVDLRRGTRRADGPQGSRSSASRRLRCSWRHLLRRIAFATCGLLIDA